MIKFDAVDCKQKYEIMKENAETLAKRIDKAIEYIDKHIRIDDEYPDYMEMLVEEKNELLNILKGSENNE